MIRTPHTVADGADTNIQIDLTAARGDFALAARFTVPAAGVTALFGVSGSGKTSLLHAIAGFTPAQGHISVANEVWLDSAQGIDVRAHQRGVGYMFQEPRLFPHLNVAGNLDYARRRATERAPVVEFESVIAAFELGSLLQRTPAELSGGEAQRVALVRTLLRQPSLLLLDEPLAALDDQRKNELLPYLETLVSEFRLPMFYVSHDVDEVARLAERMVVLKDGAVQAAGPTADLFERLDLQDSIGRFEASVLLNAVVAEQDEQWQLTRLSVAGQSLTVPQRAGLAPGDGVRVRLRARDVALATRRPEATSIRNILAGRVVQLLEVPDTAFTEVVIALDDGAARAGGAARVGGAARADGEETRVRSRITRAAVADLQLAPEARVFALIKSVTFDF